MEQLLNELNERGIKLWVDGGNLGIRAPKGALTEELRQSLATYKEDLLTVLRVMEQREKIPTIIPQPELRYEPFPLVEAQQAYWIGRTSYVESGGVSTHLYMEMEHVALDVERLNTSLRKVIERHDMLRAVIDPDGQQRILKDVPPYQIKVEDLRGKSEEEQRAGQRRGAGNQGGSPGALSDPPLAARAPRDRPQHSTG